MNFSCFRDICCGDTEILRSLVVVSHHNNTPFIQASHMRAQPFYNSSRGNVIGSIKIPNIKISNYNFSFKEYYISFKLRDSSFYRIIKYLKLNSINQ